MYTCCVTDNLQLPGPGVGKHRARSQVPVREEIFTGPCGTKAKLVQNRLERLTLRNTVRLPCTNITL